MQTTTETDHDHVVRVDAATLLGAQRAVVTLATGTTALVVPDRAAQD